MAETLKVTDIPVRNFGAFMIDRMKEYGGSIPLIDGLTDKRYTYRDVIYLKERLAAGLQSIGVSKGDVVGVVSHNNIDYVIVSYATALITSVVQPVNPIYTQADLNRTFRECKTKVVIVDQQFLSKVKDAVKDIPHIQIVVFGDSEADGCIAFDSPLNLSYGDYRTPPCDLKTTTMMLLSSSGTTGFPKAVQIQHYAIIVNIYQLQGADLFKEMIAVYCIYHCSTGYGQAETGVTHLNTDTAFRDKSVGKPLPLTEVKSVDPDTGKGLGINRESELWIRGPQVCLGYLNLPAETRQRFLPDECTRTGDIGYRDEDGFYFIVDRIKELIKYKGYQVAPATLEDILLRHDAVGDVGVIGVADEEVGEIPRAYIVLKAGKQTNASELQQFVAVCSSYVQ